LRKSNHHDSQKEIVRGASVGSSIAKGLARVILNPKDIHQFKEGEILVTEMTDPDWEPIMKIASGIITDKGGRTSHAAIVSRELGIPCIVGAFNATKVLRDGMEITLDCSGGQSGVAYEGKLPFEVVEHKLGNLPKTRTKIMVNVGSPEEAFGKHFLPVSGVGLGRLEFIITSHIQIHPNAVIDYEKLKNLMEVLNLLSKEILVLKHHILFFMFLIMFKINHFAII